MPTNRFVAMFDILGFRALRRELGTAGLYKRFEQFTLPLMQHAAAGRGKIIDAPGGRAFVPDFHEGSVEYRIISDTVILIAKDASFSSFLSIVTSSTNLLKYGLLGMKTPYRGAIGYGDAVIDGPHMLVGEAVEDAYEAESRQVWSGCMLSPACESFVLENEYLYQFFWGVLALAEKEPDAQKQMGIVEEASRIAHYLVPIQTNAKNETKAYATQNAYVIDWTIGLYDGAASKSFGQSDDEHAKKIKKNTMDFEVWARKNNRRGGVGPLPTAVAAPK